MSDKGKRTIFVGPADSVDGKPWNEEAICTEVCLPGAVLDYAGSSAGFELMDDAATVFGKPLLVADKDQQRSKSVDDSWTLDESMVAIRPRSGERVNVLVITAQALVVGTALTRSVGTPGALVIAATDGTEEILCYADEIITTSGTELVRVRAA